MVCTPLMGVDYDVAVFFEPRSDEEWMHPDAWFFLGRDYELFWETLSIDGMTRVDVEAVVQASPGKGEPDDARRCCAADLRSVLDYGECPQNKAFGEYVAALPDEAVILFLKYN